MNLRPFTSIKSILNIYGVEKIDQLAESSILHEQLGGKKVKGLYVYQTSKRRYYLKVLETNGMITSIGKDINNLDNQNQSIVVTPAKIKKALEQKGEINSANATAKGGQVEAKKQDIELKLQQIKDNFTKALVKNSVQGGKTAFNTMKTLLVNSIEEVISLWNTIDADKRERERHAREQINALIKEFVDTTGRDPQIDPNIYLKKLKAAPFIKS